MQSITKIVSLHFNYLGREEIRAVQLVEVVSLFNCIMSGFPMYRMMVCRKLPVRSYTGATILVGS